MRLNHFRLPPLPLERTLASALIALATLFALMKPISAIDLDIFLRMGAWIHEHRAVLEIEPFALAAQGVRFQNGTWLAQLLLFEGYRFGGYPALQILLALLVTATLITAGRHAAQRTNGRVVALGVLVALAFLLQNLAIRPQSFSLPLFALIYLLLDRYPDRRFTPPLLFLAMGLWTNLHGAFPIAFALPAAYWLEDLRASFTAPPAPGATSAPPPGRARPQRRTARPRATSPASRGGQTRAAFPSRWFILGLVMAAATLLNPYGPAIYRYILENSALPVQRQLSEWLPPQPLSFLGARFFGALLLTAVLAVWKRERVRLSDLLLLSAFAILGARSQRMIVWWGLLAGPILASWLAAPSRALEPPQRLHTRIGWSLEVFWLCLYLVAFSRLAPGSVDARGDYANLDEQTPVEAATFLNGRPGGRLFHRLEWGSYLAWRLWPAWQTFIDIRVWIFPEDLWQAYLAAGRGEPGWQALMDRFRVTTLVLSRETQQRLIDAALRDPGWREVHRDRLAVVFERGSERGLERASGQ